jgi:hypothetical protein
VADAWLDSGVRAGAGFGGGKPRRSMAGPGCEAGRARGERVYKYCPGAVGPRPRAGKSVLVLAEVQN